MLTENEVVGNVVEYLKNNGYKNVVGLMTNQKGVDVTAISPHGGVPLLVEVKGGTSSKSHTSRYGLPFTNNQKGSHVCGALYASIKNKQNNPSAKVAIALPDDAEHRNLIEAIKDGIKALNIGLFYVDVNGGVAYIP